LPPVVFDAVPGYPAALSQTVKVAVGSSAPLIAIASPLAAVGVPLKVTLIDAEERLPKATPCRIECLPCRGVEYDPRG